MSAFQHLVLTSALFATVRHGGVVPCDLEQYLEGT